MKNSQYVNQMNVNINDMVRIEFNDIPDGHNSNHVITICAHVDAAEMMAKAILETVERHRRTVEIQKQSNNTDKKLS